MSEQGQRVDIFNSVNRATNYYDILNGLFTYPMVFFLLLNAIWFVGYSGLIDGPTTLLKVAYFFGIPLIAGVFGFILPPKINVPVTLILFVYLAVTCEHGPFQPGVELAEMWKSGSLSLDVENQSFIENVDAFGESIKETHGMQAYALVGCVLLFGTIFGLPLLLLTLMSKLSYGNFHGNGALSRPATMAFLIAAFFTTLIVMSA